MMHKYHCACCNKAVHATEKVCPQCGSQYIRSPYGLWIFCIFACLFTAITFKVGHVYFGKHNVEAPEQITLLDVLNQDVKKNHK